MEQVGDKNSELLNKIDSLLKVIPETPQPSEESSKMRTRNSSKLINVINKDSDQNSEQTTEEGSISGKDINPINSKHWKTPSNLIRIPMNSFVFMHTPPSSPEPHNINLQ